MVVILQILSVVFLLFLGGLVWRQDTKDALHQRFLYFTFALSGWLIAGILSNIVTPYYLIFNKLIFVFPILMVLAALDLVMKLSGSKSKLGYILGHSGIFVAAITVFTNGVVMDVLPRFSDATQAGYDVTRGGIYYVYIFYLVVCSFAALTILALKARDLTGKKKDQLVIVGWGLVATLTVGMLVAFVAPAITGTSSSADFSFITGFIITLSFAYAIAKYDLFDIKLVAVRGVAYVGVLVSLSGIYYASAYVLSTILLRDSVTSSVSVSPINILLALVLAFLFQPIKKFFDKFTSNIFYRDRYDSDKFFAQLGKLLASTIDLRDLLGRASNEIADTFKSEQVFFFLYYTSSTGHHMSAGTKSHTQLSLHDTRTLDTFFNDHTEAVYATDFLQNGSVVKNILSRKKIALVMPLKYDSNIIGYVFIGDHMSGGGYTKRDLSVLSTTSDELVIAIQNALSLHAVKEINATLQQRIDVATKELRSSNAQLRHLDEVKDEFMSMASHQLRTPLTSIKGYMSMVLEGDMGKITPQQEQVLTEAFNSSERMVRLIADFLNVSRLQTGKFMIEKAPSNIVDVVRTEVSSLQVMSATHDMKLTYKPLKAPIMIDMDEAKVRQVIMNFIDNAIYYSRAKTTITVSLEHVGDKVEFRVKDTGIGVPIDEQPMLFSKFFRAKNARKQRPDGTGVGLYLAKKVIIAHDGQMIFESVEGHGSTFGFTIPIKSKE